MTMNECLSCQDEDELSEAGLCEYCQDEADAEAAQERLREESEWHLPWSNAYGSVPAINIKLYIWPTANMITQPLVRAYYEAANDQDSEYAWETIHETFWEVDLDFFAEDHGIDPKNLSNVGRSGGWLIFNRKGEWQYWDAKTVDNWLEFAKTLRSYMDKDVPRLLAFETARHAALRLDNNDLLELFDTWNVTKEL